MWLEEALRVFTHLTTLSLCYKIILLIVKQIHQVKKNRSFRRAFSHSSIR